MHATSLLHQITNKAFIVTENCYFFHNSLIKGFQQIHKYLANTRILRHHSAATPSKVWLNFQCALFLFYWLQCCMCLCSFKWPAESVECSMAPQLLYNCDSEAIARFNVDWKHKRNEDLNNSSNSFVRWQMMEPKVNCSNTV